MTKRQVFDEFARIGQALASGARIELLDLLFQSERTVEQLAAESGMTVTNVSQHLQVLRRSRMVEVRREGLYAFYRLANDEVFQIWKSIRGFGEAHVLEVKAALFDFLKCREGLEEVSAAELKKRMKDGTAIVIDVRPRMEYDAGHIPGAISIPVQELEKHLASLPRRKEIVAYCRGPYCVQSDAAVELLAKRGFKAKRLEFGMPEWRDMGLTVETATA
ncbi:ArsR/SmtB family transcription factor [Nibricoccus sp. IMCC34717]|uniref:ArsR/SmtB family transcription factor n=1 Tax=Nibricoccus sp. IMCC34717 TaxID=3034021 RepID=UPI00384B735B